MKGQTKCEMTMILQQRTSQLSAPTAEHINLLNCICHLWSRLAPMRLEPYTCEAKWLTHGSHAGGCGGSGTTSAGVGCSATCGGGRGWDCRQTRSGDARALLVVPLLPPLVAADGAAGVRGDPHHCRRHSGGTLMTACCGRRKPPAKKARSVLYDPYRIGLAGHWHRNGYRWQTNQRQTAMRRRALSCLHRQEAAPRECTPAASPLFC